MSELFTPDPENNPEEEAELTYRLYRAVHSFYDPEDTGRCVEETEKYCYEHKKVDWHQPCGLPSYSVLHYDAFADAHYHGGGDCMCFENRY
jgi:hypothetical protein